MPDVHVPDAAAGGSRPDRLARAGGPWAGAEKWLLTGPAARARTLPESPRQGPSSRAYTVEVDGRRCSTLAETLETLASALEFPAYYGHNSDAFIECLSDLLVVGPEGGLGSQFGDRRGVASSAVEVAVSHPDEFVPAPQDRAQLIRVVNFALDRPAPAGSTKVPLRLVLGSGVEQSSDPPSPAPSQ